MFTAMQNFGTRKPIGSAYREIGANTAVEDASPHKLVSLLYGELLNQIARARGAIARKEIGEKGQAIGHAVRIIEEGLAVSLDMQSGGAIAVNLRDVYAYIVQRLTMANLKSDDAMLSECARLVETLREGWDGIAGQVQSTPRAAR